MALDYKTGSFLHMPYDGGLMKQPYRTMKIWQIVQGCFIEHVGKEISKIQAK